MDRRLIFTVILLVVFISSLSVNFILLTRQQVTPSQASPGGGSSTILTIKVFGADGHLKASMVKVGDIFTSNFFNGSRIALFGQADSSFTLYSNGTGSAVSFTPGTYLGGSYLSYIAIGSSTTSPTVWDYQLGSQLYSAQVSSWGIFTSGNQINASVSTSITITSPASISEAGLFVFSPSTNQYYLVNHDTFTPVSVTTGDIVQVEYTYVFN